MGDWACGITGCGSSFDEPAALIRHQAVNHPGCECHVCGEVVPAGYLAIRHAFDAHSRTEYVRAYDADSDDIRLREELLDLVEGRIDVQRLVGQIDTTGEEPVVSAGD